MVEKLGQSNFVLEILTDLINEIEQSDEDRILNAHIKPTEGLIESLKS